MENDGDPLALGQAPDGLAHGADELVSFEDPIGLGVARARGLGRALAVVIRP